VESVPLYSERLVLLLQRDSLVRPASPLALFV
jgi:hypothetical protein